MHFGREKSAGSLRKRGVIWTQDAPKMPWKEVKFEKRDDGDGIEDGGDDGDGEDDGGSGSGQSSSTSVTGSATPSLGAPKGKGNTHPSPGPALAPAAPTLSDQTSAESTSISLASPTSSTTTPTTSTAPSGSSQSPSLVSFLTPLNTSPSSIPPTSTTTSPTSTLTISLSSSSFPSVSQPSAASSSLSSSLTSSIGSQRSTEQSSATSTTIAPTSATQSTLLTSTTLTVSAASASVLASPQNGIGSPTPSNNGKVITAVAVVAGVAGSALLLAAVIIFVRRCFRKRGEGAQTMTGDSTIPAGPYSSLQDEPPHMPSRPRLGLRSWHESILWGSDSNSRTQSSNTLSTSDALATPTRWQDRVRSTFSNVPVHHGDPSRLEDTDIGEKSTTPPRRFDSFNSLPRSAMPSQSPEPVFLAERPRSSDNLPNKATPWTKGETTKGGKQMRELSKLPAGANEMALQRELERQGFGGSVRSLPGTDFAVVGSGSRRDSDTVTEPPRWRTAISWVRDQAERVGNRISISAASKTGRQ